MRRDHPEATLAELTGGEHRKTGAQQGRNERDRPDVDEVRLIEAFLARKFRNKPLAVHLEGPRHMASVYRKLRLAGFSSGNAIRVLKRYAERADELASLEDEEPEA